MSFSWTASSSHICRGILYGRTFTALSISFSIGAGTRSDTVTVPFFLSRETRSATAARFFAVPYCRCGCGIIVNLAKANNIHNTLMAPEVAYVRENPDGQTISGLL